MPETATSPLYSPHNRPHQPMVDPAATASPSAAAAATTTTSSKSKPASSSMPPSLLSPHIAASLKSNRPPQTPSPNYFGFQGDSQAFPNDGLQHAERNWSPPSSTVRSAAIISPTVVPLDQHPDYDAFRRQSQSKGLSLSGLASQENGATANTQPRSTHRRPAQNITPPQQQTNHYFQSSDHARFSQPSTTSPDLADLTSHADSSPPLSSGSSQHTYRSSLDPSTADLSRSPKRVLSPGSNFHSTRRGSPASFASAKTKNDSGPSAADVSRIELFSEGMAKHRAETLPMTTEIESPTVVTPQFVVNLLEAKEEEILLLDLRVATQYGAAHITGALNLCIPTTLLKRPAFNVRKLAEAFQHQGQRSRFENWRKSSYIIVYDGHSVLPKDATICLNTIKKFRGEDYTGTACFIKGGFNEFAKRFPALVEHATQESLTPDGLSSPSGSSSAGSGPLAAPVVGGCPMPSTDQPMNPFFGNIRQNMDLIGGVGQIPLKHPTRAIKEEYPRWLRQAANDQDQGKQVSTKFEKIERREKKRMEDALRGQVSWGTPKPGELPQRSVQIAGLEKGNKNRYNNIWPFEHSRVKLQGVPTSGCDYFNASHIKAAWSNKRFISTQAPIPGTFNDFWNVVWQQDVRVIVMLTAEKEGGQVKAHNYWNEKRYGNLHLGHLSEKRASIEPARIRRHQRRLASDKQRSSSSSSNSAAANNPAGVGLGVPLAQLDTREEKNSEQPYVTVRRFTLSHDKFPFEPMREITQLQYSSWPDFGAPAHPAHLLGIVEQCDAVVRSLSKASVAEPEPPNTRPVLVHCSAGCGRTGTFCTVDSVIDMLKRQRLSESTRHRQPPPQRSQHRELSPMDIERPGPHSHAQRSHAGADSGFFAFDDGTRNGTADGPEGEDRIDGDWLRLEDCDLVEKTVEDFRLQRISMVQSLRQYVLCYESIMEWLVGDEQGS